MIEAISLQRLLDEQHANEALIDLIPSIEMLLPSDVTFEQDVWNILAWKTRKGKSKVLNIYFHRIRNLELRTYTKLYVLEKRQRKSIVAGTAKALVLAIEKLDNALGYIPIQKISNAIFYEAQVIINEHVKNTSAPRHAGYLEDFGRWLSANLGYRISYKCTLESQYQHGRRATDLERDNKLIDTRILIDLISKNQSESLILKDEYYLSVLTLLVGTGFRIGELATLPLDCLIYEGNNAGIRFYPEKCPKVDIRWLEPDYVPAIEQAIDKLTDLSYLGRMAIRALRKNPGLDWSEILKDMQAAEYFVAKFCHDWTSNPIHNMFSQEGAWLEKEKRHIDIIDLVDQVGSQIKAAKILNISRNTVVALLKSQHAALNNELSHTAKSAGKNKRTSWDQDSRVISINQLSKKINLHIHQKSRKNFAHIIEDARDNYQLKGNIYPHPPFNEELEDKFKRVINPVIVSKEGKSILIPEEALMITLKYQLAENYETIDTDYSLITDKSISRWLSGEKRALGTKNFEDSCFSRLEIIDPKTGEIAKFVPHDIRHWLTTYLLEGGMPSEQVALLFNRAPNQNDIYDQTSSKTRLNNMRQAIRDGGAIGHVAETYNNISEYSRLEAEQYLKASTLQLNNMPHGGCSLNWGMKACKNHNGCFNGEDGLCDDLCIDPTEPDTKLELERILVETNTALLVIPEKSPQYNHYQNIQKNLNKLFGVENE